ncbi:MAG: biotin-dependent carboxyltransferase family protein [Burkholderiaceae bacterium]|nr:biotin-dependent carboxyltransferase family protein [Burkholderiaceae bacterium]
MLRPGVLSTVQDRGRHGLQHLGVVPGGAMDLIAHDIANALVGNPADAATLELTLLGPELQFADEALIALCGARFDASLDGSRLPLDRPVLVKAGSRLALGRALHGCRGYLAIAGGILVGQVLGSRSTYLPASFGGLAGRILHAGDKIPLAENAPALARQRFAALGPGVAAGAGMRSVRWFAPPLTVISNPDHQFAVLPGRHYDRFTAKAQDALYESSWRVSPDSNRMGFRLTGLKLETERKLEIISEPTCLGTVQVPANGTPIVLMADHQTTGGYPKIAEVASVDIPAFAQLAPGEELRFTRCTLEQARERRIAARSVLAAVMRSIATEYAK